MEDHLAGTGGFTRIMQNRPLTLEAVYNELTGEECYDILLTRFADILSRVPEFSHTLTLPRVKMNLTVRLEVEGRTPAAFHINDEFTVRINPQSPALTGPATITHNELTEVVDINADSSTPKGTPPDQLRVEHSIPVHIPTRTPEGIQDVPTVLEGAKYFKPEVRGRTITVELDYGPARNRTGGEGMASIPILAERNSHGGTPDVPMQQDFRVAIKDGNDSRKAGA